MKFFRRGERELLNLILNDEDRAWNALYGDRLTGLRVSPRATDGAPTPNGAAASLLPGGGTRRALWEGSE